MSKKHHRPTGIYVASTVVVIFACSGCSLMNRQKLTPTRAARASIAARRSTNDQREEEPSEHAGPRGQYVDSGAEAGNYGTYVGGGSTATTSRSVVMGATGAFYMPYDCLTTRFGVIGADDAGIGAGGIEAGARLHTSNRFSPYVGITGAAAFSSFHKGYPWAYQYHSNQRRAMTVMSGIEAAGPESGVSYWINPSTRLNAGVSYYMSQGQPFFLVYGLSLDVALGSRRTPPDDNPPRTGQESQQEIDDAKPYEDVKDVLSKYISTGSQEEPLNK